MSNLICSLIPKHNRYIEPFFGGGSVFFLKKDIAEEEIINDKNYMIYNFWKVVKEDGFLLYKKVLKIIYEDTDIRKPDYKIYKGEIEANNIEKAYAVFLLLHTSFSGEIGLRFLKNEITKKAIKQKKQNILSSQLRLKKTTIYNKDALDIIKEQDKKDAFFYLDPPYPETYQKHYKGYSMQDFNKLTSLLKTIKGKFLLSCYLKEGMNLDKNWIIKSKTLNKKLSRLKATKRTEALIKNYTA